MRYLEYFATLNKNFGPFIIQDLTTDKSVRNLKLRKVKYLAISNRFYGLYSSLPSFSRTLAENTAAINHRNSNICLFWG